MPTNRSNLAYDLSRYESHPPQKEKRPNIKVQRAVEKSASAPKSMALIVLCGALMCGMLYGKAQASAVQTELTAATKRVDMLSSEKVRMQSEIEGKTSMQNVEDYAENVLGLKKLDRSQIEYIQLETDNVVEIPQDNTNIFVRIKNWFDGILAYLQG